MYVKYDTQNRICRNFWPLWVEYVSEVCYTGLYYTAIYYIYFKKIYYTANIV
jgi:hypothetical protein